MNIQPIDLIRVRLRRYKCRDGRGQKSRVTGGLWRERNASVEHALIDRKFWPPNAKIEAVDHRSHKYVAVWTVSLSAGVDR